MKKKVVVFIVVLLSTFCNAQENASTANKNKQKSHIPDSTLQSLNFISLSVAEKILEQPSRIKDSIWKFEGEIWKYKCVYNGNLKDSVKGRASLYFGFEHYKQIKDAKRFYDLTKAENAKSSTVTDLSKTGDEAFLVKDQLNCPLIIIRKANKIFKLKVYNINSATSLNQLQLLAKQIIPSH